MLTVITSGLPELKVNTARAISGMSSYKGTMKKVPPTRPTMNPRDNTNRRFLLPMSGVRSAVEKQTPSGK